MQEEGRPRIKVRTGAQVGGDLGGHSAGTLGRGWAGAGGAIPGTAPRWQGRRFPGGGKQRSAPGGSAFPYFIPTYFGAMEIAGIGFIFPRKGFKIRTSFSMLMGMLIPLPKGPLPHTSPHPNWELAHRKRTIQERPYYWAQEPIGVRMAGRGPSLRGGALSGPRPQGRGIPQHPAPPPGRKGAGRGRPRASSHCASASVAG